MLVLSRKVGEKILIGNFVEVMVTEIKGDKVRLGITAPAFTQIVRPDAKDKTGAKRKAIRCRGKVVDPTPPSST